MIVQITALNYKIKPESLERFHNLSEYAESRMFEWEQAINSTSTLGHGYVEKPYIEPQEFKESDYVITEKPLLVRKEDFRYCTVNRDGVTELSIDTRTGIVTFNVKNSLEEINKIFSE